MFQERMPTGAWIEAGPGGEAWGEEEGAGGEEEESEDESEMDD